MVAKQEHVSYKKHQKGTGGGSPSRSPSIISKMVVESATVNSTKYAGIVGGVATKLDSLLEETTVGDTTVIHPPNVLVEVTKQDNAGTTYECGNQGPSVKKSRSVSYIAEEERMSFINNLVSGSGQENNELADVQIRSFAAMETFFKCATEKMQEKEQSFSQTLAGFMDQ
ncbi:hypothetical protein MAR_011302 [Mya arenaria]|uniref:Uncharacterized protein n=1 Tax=Mya arenaria TaxID=6604 RepID=A0ABY7FXK3_MYAAR|nr:hypothetical protein MAR_011302 [Mya arenaria]